MSGKKKTDQLSSTDLDLNRKSMPLKISSENSWPGEIFPQYFYCLVELSFLILFKQTTMRRSSGYIEPSGKLAALLRPSVWCKHASDHDVLISESGLQNFMFQKQE